MKWIFKSSDSKRNFYKGTQYVLITPTLTAQIKSQLVKTKSNLVKIKSHLVFPISDMSKMGCC